MKTSKSPLKLFNKIFINNEFVNSVSGKTFPTVNPSTREKITDVAESDEADVDLAVIAARDAFCKWRLMDASARGKLIYKLAELIERDIQGLAELETLDNGKPLSLSIVDIKSAVQTFRYYAGWCDKIQGNTIPSDFSLTSFTVRQPIGIVGQIIPWNFPIAMTSWKWGPALAAGCTVILKPAEQTPLTALQLGNFVKQAGFPPGVVNILPGYGRTVGAAISRHPCIDKIAFTGSHETARKILIDAASTNLKKVSLELGGKSPLVIMDDADVTMGSKLAHNAVFVNNGQTCSAGSRTFVHHKIYDEFVTKATKLAETRKIADPLVKGTMHGPQIDETMFNKILKYIKYGKEEGAKLETGGEIFGDKGFFIKPAVFSNVKDEMRIAKEEIFGPVQCILKFDDLDEVIDRSNDTTFGLAAGIITKDINKAMTYAKGVDAGSVWINCYNAVVPQAPFGGFKQSGSGRDLGEEALGQYLEVKTVTMKITNK